MSTMSLRLPDYLHDSIREIADSEHISVNQLVTVRSPPWPPKNI
jgi:predicted HicB family RNase H-like nuclease